MMDLSLLRTLLAVAGVLFWVFIAWDLWRNPGRL
jgi:hypothetical protein